MIGRHIVNPFCFVRMVMDAKIPAEICQGKEFPRRRLNRKNRKNMTKTESTLARSNQNRVCGYKPANKLAETNPQNQLFVSPKTIKTISASEVNVAMTETNLSASKLAPNILATKAAR